MMISPEVYIEGCKEYPYEQLLEERGELMAEIMRLEDVVLWGEDCDSFMVSPGPDVQYIWCLECLAGLSNLMAERMASMRDQDEQDFVE